MCVTCVCVYLNCASRSARAHFQRSLSGEAGPGAAPSLLGGLWSWVIMAFVLYFVVGLVEGIAQARQAHLDQTTKMP